MGKQRERIRTEEINLGMQLVSRLPEIMPDEADDKVRPIYEDVKNTFRAPVVNFFFRVLANYPSYLVAAWNEFGPYLRTIKLEEAADELRSAALLEPVPDSSGINGAALGELQKIRRFTDTIHYILPKLLFAATAFHESLWSGAQASNGEPGGSADEILYGIADGMMSIPMVDAAKASSELTALFEEIKERHGHPGVATYYRSLGRWPRFLLGVWERIKPIVGSPRYEQRKQAVLEQAIWALENCFATWKGFSIEESVSSRELEEIRAICAVFRFRLVSDLLLDVSLIKAMLDGPEAARTSRFSFQR